MRDVSRVVAVDLRTTGQSKEVRLPHLLYELGLGDQTQECFWVVAYDAALNLRTVTEVARGTYSRVRVHMPSVYGAVLGAGADRFTVAHNHPTGDASPTSKDMELTGTIMAGANALGLFFEDHWIVTPKRNKNYSFTVAGLLVPANYINEQDAAVK